MDTGENLAAGYIFCIGDKGQFSRRTLFAHAGGSIFDQPFGSPSSRHVLGSKIAGRLTFAEHFEDVLFFVLNRQAVHSDFCRGRTGNLSSHRAHGIGRGRTFWDDIFGTQRLSGSGQEQMYRPADTDDFD